ncbi:hypothetical protein [Prochlorococcus marinus]|uniref:hypothetical protein n=1 Tax=Prochlorococcus marinus TaxID=1219 RepID=UPI0022B4893E|nr:hypothetical protein [Prochlorococcus marinus]
MKYNKLRKSLYFISNLAIPPNDKINQGLGTLLDSYENKFNNDLALELIKNHIRHFHFLETLMDLNLDSYEEVCNKINDQFSLEENRIFYDEFRIYAVKTYFSHPLVLTELDLLYNGCDLNKVMRTHEDRMILDSIIEND